MAKQIIDLKKSADWCKIYSGDETYKHSVRPQPRPGFWKWSDVLAAAEKMSKDPIASGERRFVALINESLGLDAFGTNSGFVGSVMIGILILKPKEHQEIHRHTASAIYHVVKGHGWGILGYDDEKFKFNWEPGDTIACTPWAWHEWYNESNEEALFYVVQGLTGQLIQRMAIWEEPAGNLFFPVKGKTPGGGEYKE